MGKVKTIDREKEAQKAQEKAQKEAERLAKIAEEKAKAAGKKKTAEPVIANEEPVIPSEAEESQSTNKEEISASQALSNDTSELKEKKIHVISKKREKSQERNLSAEPRDDNSEEKTTKKISKYAAKQKIDKRQRSEKYLSSAKMVDKSKQYAIKDALELLEKIHLASFDETVELHITTTSVGVSGTITLPHGTGKSVRVAILTPASNAAAADALLKEIGAGKINFDVLVATPDAMPRLAKVAKVLGPRGLMPNPKNGTITTNPEAVAQQYEAGQFRYKTEAKAPVIHVALGKLSFGKTKLTENIETFLHEVKPENIKKAVVKSTMSPAIKLLVK